ncbi:YdcF family protein [Jannaschia sp. 2305UL9-9]|uniref:YdcF family protein n=1 Tax=Jannaschia sp. 2305UL9-9 TaxID=3121638 RepID=UPI0035286B78
MKVALVLGAKVRADGTPSPTLRLRVVHAVGLYRAGAVDAICVSGGKGAFGLSEGEVGADLARAMGVPARALIAETRSRNTIENLKMAAPLIRGRPVIIVTNRWHLPRAMLAARLMGLSATGSGVAGRTTRARALRAILREVAAVPPTILRALCVRWARRSAP